MTTAIIGGSGTPEHQGARHARHGRHQAGLGSRSPSHQNPLEARPAVVTGTSAASLPHPPCLALPGAAEAPAARAAGVPEDHRSPLRRVPQTSTGRRVSCVPVSAQDRQAGILEPPPGEVAGLLELLVDGRSTAATGGVPLPASTAS